MISSTS